MNPLDRIVVDPVICLGQPTIKGTRITIGVIMKMLGNGYPVDAVLDAYPELVRDDVLQAMKFAAWVISDQVQILPKAA